MDENQKSVLMQKIQQYYFAAYDMLLYLDTHPNDEKAFEMFRELCTAHMRLSEQYRSSYGPLTSEDLIFQKTFNWTEAPFPWEKSANSYSCKGGTSNV